MKKRVKNILTAITLLLFFATGQVIVFTHSHAAFITQTSHSKHTPANADESCKVCQINHASTALLNIQLPNAVVYGVAYKQLQATSRSYQSISLVLATTRGPPNV